MSVYDKIIVVALTGFFLAGGFSPSQSCLFLPQKNAEAELAEKNTEFVCSDVEYWGLLVAVGVYKDHPDADRYSMLSEVEDLYNNLLLSDWWSEDHIKVVKGEDATFLNILNGLTWLNKMVDKNDFSLVYITTHGDSLHFRNKKLGLNIPLDLLPFDEEDFSDEILVTYYGFNNPFVNLRDDILNFFLSKLRSRGVCLIVDSCHSGGFNDPPYGFNGNIAGSDSFSSRRWMESFGGELSSEGRVVLMSCEEDQLSYGSFFSGYLNQGITGKADFNEDDVVTAEELYSYVQDQYYYGGQNPTIFDNYPGELPIVKT